MPGHYNRYTICVTEQLHRKLGVRVYNDNPQTDPASLQLQAWYVKKKGTGHETVSQNETKLIWALWSYVRMSQDEPRRPYIEIDSEGRAVAFTEELKNSRHAEKHLPLTMIADIIRRAIWINDLNIRLPNFGKIEPADLGKWFQKMDDKSQRRPECDMVEQESTGLWVDEVRDAYATWYNSAGQDSKLPAELEVRDVNGDLVDGFEYSHPRPSNEKPIWHCEKCKDPYVADVSSTLDEKASEKPEHYNRYEKSLHPYSLAQQNSGVLPDYPSGMTFPDDGTKHPFMSEEAKLYWALQWYVRMTQSEPTKPYILLDDKGKPTLNTKESPEDHLPLQMFARIIRRAVYGYDPEMGAADDGDWFTRTGKTPNHALTVSQEVQDESSGLWVDKVRDAYAAWRKSDNRPETSQLPVELEIHDARGELVEGYQYSHKRPSNENGTWHCKGCKNPYA